jgi:hypothetical protein
MRESATFDRNTIAEIQRAAETGIYDIRGWGPNARCRISTTCCSWAPRCRATHWRGTERCGTDVVLGGRNAKHPLHLDIPVTSPG